MDLSYVKKLIKLVSESEVDEVEIEEQGKKIRVVKSKPNIVATVPVASLSQQAAMEAPIAAPVAQPPAAAPSAAPAPSKSSHHEIRSPIVGTFYRSPGPDAAPFVDIGSSISTGTVLCIVEAMKLMNEIESDVSGKIVKVMVENGQPVEYDQVLFIVDKP